MRARVGVAGLVAGVVAVITTTAPTPAASVAPTAGPLLAGSLPTWSPGGTEIAFATFDVATPWTFRVDVVSPSGVDRRVVTSFARGGIAAGLRWAGSRRLILSTDPNGELRRINVLTGKWIELDCPGGVGSGCGPLSLGAGDNFAVSADGSRIAYSGDSPYENANRTSSGPSPDMFAIGDVLSSGGTAHVLPQPINASDAYPSFSPDGSQVVFTRSYVTNGITSAPSLMVQSVTGGQARPLGHIQGDRPVWSPDGRWIAYEQMTYGPHGLLPAELKIVSASGGSSHSLFNPKAHDGLTLSWSPDSTRVAFTTQSGELGIATLTGKVTIFKLPAWMFVAGYASNGVPAWSPQWSPDSKTLVFTGAPRSDHKEMRVYTIRANGKALHRLG